MSEKQIDYNVSYQQNFYCHIKINDTPLIPGNIISLVVMMKRATIAATKNSKDIR